MPGVKKWEQELDRKLLTERQIKTGSHCIKFEIKGLLRGDIKTRTAFYMALLDRKVLTPNQVRELEGMNKIDGGDTVLDSANFPAQNSNNNGNNGESDTQ